MSQSKSMNPNCYRCHHYFVTWDVAFPYGCRAMGFKSRRLPHLDVRRTMQGVGCLSYKPKIQKRLHRIRRKLTM